MIAWLGRQWDRLLERLAAFSWNRGSFRIVRLPDPPDRLQPATLYVIGDDGYDWAAVMLCPGGCGKVLELNLYPDADPVWKLTSQGNAAPTLTPSVWLTTGCGCHFFLRRGRVIWV